MNYQNTQHFHYQLEVVEKDLFWEELLRVGCMFQTIFSGRQFFEGM